MMPPVQTGQPLLGAVLFPVGFILLYLLGFDLLTGVFTLAPLALIDKRPGVTMGGILRNWGLVFCGNFAGALTVMDFLEAAAQDGILIKDGRVLEQLDKIDTLVFDVAALLVINTDGKKTLLPGTLECMTALRAQGMKLWLVSVEPETLTAGWAGQLGVETYVSDAMPQDKVDLVQHLRAEGSFVAYVGDGIGDAVPMRLAQIAISINGINALVQDTAQVILLDQNLQHLSGLLALSQRFEASMKRSAWLTTVPNMVSIGGTFLGLVGYATAIGIFFAVLGGGMLNVFGSTLRRQAAHPTASAPIPPILHVCPTTEESS